MSRRRQRSAQALDGDAVDRLFDRVKAGGATTAAEAEAVAGALAAAREGVPPQRLVLLFGLLAESTDQAVALVSDIVRAAHTRGDDETAHGALVAMGSYWGLATPAMAELCLDVVEAWDDAVFPDTFGLALATLVPISRDDEDAAIFERLKRLAHVRADPGGRAPKDLTRALIEIATGEPKPREVERFRYGDQRDQLLHPSSRARREDG